MQRIFHGAVYALLAAYSPVWQLPKYNTPYILDTYCTIWCELSLGGSVCGIRHMMVPV